MTDLTEYRRILEAILCHPPLTYKDRILAWYIFDRTLESEYCQVPAIKVAAETGINKDCVHKGLRLLEKKGILIKRSRNKHREGNVYSFNPSAFD